MTDKPTPTDAATPECLTCSDHGAVGNSGFDYKTAADFLSGKTVSDEALRKFVAASRGAHDARAALHAKMLSLRGELASREAEIALLKRSLLDAEADAAAPQPPTAPAAQQAGATGKCRGPRCMASSANGYAHSRECINEAAETQGWTPTANDYAKCGTPAMGWEPAGTVGYTVHGTQYVNWRTKPPAHGTPIYTTPKPLVFQVELAHGIKGGQHVS